MRPEIIVRSFAICDNDVIVLAGRSLACICRRFAVQAESQRYPRSYDDQYSNSYTDPLMHSL